MKGKSRPQRWREACAAAIQALEELVEIRDEYQDWQDNLPENLWDSPLGEKLGEVVDLDIDSALDVVQEAEDMDLPRGFGRD